MKSRLFLRFTTLTFFVALTISVGLAAPGGQGHKNSKHHHYQLIDLGTFDGPQSWVPGVGEGPGGAVSNTGAVTGAANTPDSNPFYSYPCAFAGSITCEFFGTPDLFVEHAFRFENGALTDRL